MFRYALAYAAALALSASPARAAFVVSVGSAGVGPGGTALVDVTIRSTDPAGDRLGGARDEALVQVEPLLDDLRGLMPLMRQLPDMPRWKIIVSSRSVWISPYLARRPSPVTLAPVSRWPRSFGNDRRKSARRISTRVIRRPSSTRSRPRTVVSTSGNSGMEDDMADRPQAR